MRTLVVAQLAQRGDRGEDRIAVVGAAAAVELAVLDYRRPRAKARAPADHLRLLVQVAVEQHGVLALARAGHVDEKARRTAFEPHGLELHPGNGIALAPLRGVLGRLVNVAVGLPVAVEVRRFRRDADVLDQRRDDRVVPEFGNSIHFCGGT